MIDISQLISFICAFRIETEKESCPDNEKTLFISAPRFSWQV